ncbi:lysophospholipid acyltransferase family protein [Sphingomonas sp. BGYR3]|uniref:lysophospholipid acyltransferase family protein n=1 Tax=Sphingomonas sp. BGYR3 TaxID=2975483 RepID=UPI0021A3BD1D|nr:lysophospholipid acyltransferase family protein [Sphingomonas sp. BGYR3]MDG5488622.1 lysophospholipid acyltransferase family protein [Sphingomonas sp. BGYR3]
MTIWLRHRLFQLVFVALSVPVVLAAPVSLIWGQRGLIVYAGRWAAMALAIARICAGVRIRIEGTRPEGPVLYAIKHQSMLETLVMAAHFGGPAIILKRELAEIPVWGWLAVRYGCIVADRDASARALRHIMKEGRAAAARGRSIAIFPEGTRVQPGEQPPLKSGFAGLYKLLDLPVVPIAVDSGYAWPRTGPLRAGTVTMRIGDTIPAGRSRDAIEVEVHRAINLLDRPGTLSH